MRWFQNSFAKFFKVIFNKHQMAESLISRGFLFHEPVNPAVIIKPAEAPFNFPSLATIPAFADFHFADIFQVIIPPDKNRLNCSVFKPLPQFVRIIALVRAQSYRSSDFSAHSRLIHGF